MNHTKTLKQATVHSCQIVKLHHWFYFYQEQFSGHNQSPQYSLSLTHSTQPVFHVSSLCMWWRKRLLPQDPDWTCFTTMQTTEQFKIAIEISLSAGSEIPFRTDHYRLSAGCICGHCYFSYHCLQMISPWTCFLCLSMWVRSHVYSATHQGEMEQFRSKPNRKTQLYAERICGVLVHMKPTCQREKNNEMSPMSSMAPSTRDFVWVVPLRNITLVSFWSEQPHWTSRQYSPFCRKLSNDKNRRMVIVMKDYWNTWEYRKHISLSTLMWWHFFKMQCTTPGVACGVASYASWTSICL